MYKLDEKEQSTARTKSLIKSIIITAGFLIFMRIITGPDFFEFLFDSSFFIIALIVVAVFIYFMFEIDIRNKIINEHESIKRNERKIERDKQETDYIDKVKTIVKIQSNFKVNDEIIQTSNGNVSLLVAYDNSKKQLCIVQDNGKEVFLFNSNQILKCELRAKTGSKTETIAIGETKRKGSISRAIVGGALAGGTGAIVGGISAKQQNEVNSTSMTTSYSEFFLDIYTNNANLPCLTIAKESQRTLQKWYGYILTIFQLNHDVNNIDNRKSIADEISKLKQLLDEGILTICEFEKEKQKLLNN